VFNQKAALWVKGRKGNLPVSKQFDKSVWIHCASLGEFEQGRPVIEAIKAKNPDVKILLTFFSPSGYEIRKDYPLADYVMYLPRDSRRNINIMIRVFNPVVLLVIKYEYWYHLISECNRQKVPVFLISAIFRPGNLFFKWYGRFFLKILKKIDHFFVQDELAGQLIRKYGIHNVTVSGDTRFDRVHAIAQQAGTHQLIEVFKGNALLFIAGSSWEQDEKLIYRYINEKPGSNLKYLIAPHVIHEAHLSRIEDKLVVSHSRYTRATLNSIHHVKVLILDTMGMLSALYKYGDIAYVGGGFGKGIHNTIEPATFGLPVIFGPKYRQFSEAVRLKNKKAGFPVTDYAGFSHVLDRLIEDEQFRKESSEKAKKIVKENIGATTLIIKKLDSVI
jgi:3-deoxy-D-manno-octulosonic-acid transferase